MHVILGNLNVIGLKYILHALISGSLLLTLATIRSHGATVVSDTLSVATVQTSQDTLTVTTAAVITERPGFAPDPRKASMYSAVLPGLGQIYNRKYWKVPLVYGGFAGLGWYISFTHDEFVRYRNALDFRIDGNPDTVDEFFDDPRYTQDVLVRFKDYYRRQRDLTFIFTAVFYALNIIDAAVDAHMFHFDVGEDLGMKISPSLHGAGPPAAGRHRSMGMGVSLSLSF